MKNYARRSVEVLNGQSERSASLVLVRALWDATPRVPQPMSESVLFRRLKQSLIVKHCITRNIFLSYLVKYSMISESAYSIQSFVQQCVIIWP